MTTPTDPAGLDSLKVCATGLKLHGMIAHWNDLTD